MGKIQEFREKVGRSKVDMPQKGIWRCLFAEFIGTFLLVLVGCGSATGIEKKDANGVDVTQAPQLVCVALAFALMVTTLATTIGHISGAHLNPAVTIAFFVTGKIQVLKGILYVIIQCIAAIVAIAVLKLLFPEPHPKMQFGYAAVDPKFTAGQGLGIEFFITFVLVFVIFAVCDEHRSDTKGSGPLVIGLALAAVILFAGPFTGAGINPARVLGPCVILGKYENHWIYWCGPIGGGVVAGLIYKYLFRAQSPEEIAEAELEHDKKSREKAEMTQQQRKDNGVGPEV